jgi:hypothetical protein
MNVENSIIWNWYLLRRYFLWVLIHVQQIYRFLNMFLNIVVGGILNAFESIHHFCFHLQLFIQIISVIIPKVEYLLLNLILNMILNMILTLAQNKKYNYHEILFLHIVASKISSCVEFFLSKYSHCCSEEWFFE